MDVTLRFDQPLRVWSSFGTQALDSIFDLRGFLAVAAARPERERALEVLDRAERGEIPPAVARLEFVRYAEAAGLLLV